MFFKKVPFVLIALFLLEPSVLMANSRGLSRCARSAAHHYLHEVESIELGKIASLERNVFELEAENVRLSRELDRTHWETPRPVGWDWINFRARQESLNRQIQSNEDQIFDLNREIETLTSKIDLLKEREIFPVRIHAGSSRRSR